VIRRVAPSVRAKEIGVLDLLAELEAVADAVDQRLSSDHALIVTRGLQGPSHCIAAHGGTGEEGAEDGAHGAAARAYEKDIRFATTQPAVQAMLEHASQRLLMQAR
jgi:hypothetical protein